jgi:hypothetical protein
MRDDDRDATKSIAVPLTAQDRAGIEAAPPLESIVVARYPPLGVPAEIADQMLPTERAGFATRPHPIVLVRPLSVLLAIFAVLAFALMYHVRPVVAGHHVDLPWLDARERLWALGICGLAALRTFAWLVKEGIYYAGFRIVATNRRVLATSGFFSRQVKPLGNTAMASATLVRSWSGALLGYGTVAMPGGVIRDVREPAALYREMQAVSNGVDGDRWEPALRQTRIP